ncbi:hypothetical protein LMJ53_15555 [Rheinheimera sp. UJ51]|uniref:hypothetical protein n=1 Tax=Rheinheimera sp. UJ51 TaxID=2892446 RepID=UPI001E46F6A6|nr:hypothetical protein [Rheinheimera sp. UJ51]MCC5453136.1 hypothetical protein [Rheinheimera sp. UJ51]
MPKLSENSGPSKMYSMDRKGSLALPPKENSNSYIASPTTGIKIPLKEIVIASENVWDSVYKSRYNSRNKNLLTPATVMNILPSIREAGRNTIAALAIKDENGKFEILSGMKRSYAVSISPGTSLVVHYAEKMDESDKQVLSKTADMHEKPSFLDVALSIKDYKNEVGEAFSLRKAGAIFDVSKSSIGDLVKFGNLPEELFRLFPGAGYVTWRFLKQIVDSGKDNDEIIDAIKNLDPISSDIDKVLSENAHKLLASECKSLEKEILKTLIKKEPKKVSKGFAQNSPFNEANLINGIKVKLETKGAISMTFDKVFFESDTGKKLLKLISLDS